MSVHCKVCSHDDSGILMWKLKDRAGEFWIDLVGKCPCYPTLRTGLLEYTSWKKKTNSCNSFSVLPKCIMVYSCLHTYARELDKCNKLFLKIDQTYDCDFLWCCISWYYKKDKAIAMWLFLNKSKKHVISGAIGFVFDFSSTK